MTFETVFSPSDEDVQFVRQNLREHDLLHLEMKDEMPFVIFIEDGEGVRVGGIACRIFGNWLTIDFLWVHEEHRGMGLGSSLLTRALEIGRRNACRRVSACTWSFQSPAFYQKHGFKVVYTQEGYPLTSSKHFLEKEYR